MKVLIPVVVVCCAVWTTVDGRPAEQLPIDTYREAAKKGKEDQLWSRCYATASSLDRFLVGPDGHPEYEHYHVTVAKTAGQIALFLAEARRLYRNGEAELTDRMKTDAVFVNAEPHQPSSGSAPAAIEHIVLLSKNSGAAVQPLELQITPVEWGIAVGARARPNRASARFELRQVRELPAGEFDVVLVTQYGERRCKVGAKDRERLFGGR
jgi:hypothetical protein